MWSSKEHRNNTITDVLLLVLRCVGSIPSHLRKMCGWCDYTNNSGCNTNNTNNSGYIWLYDGIKTYYIYISISGWWYAYPSEKWWSSSTGRMTSVYEMENNPVMFETTNQRLYPMYPMMFLLYSPVKNPAMATWATVFPEQLPSQASSLTSHLPNEQKSTWAVCLSLVAVEDSLEVEICGKKPFPNAPWCWNIYQHLP